MRLTLPLLLCLASAVAARAQSDFHAFLTSTNLAEGGRKEKMAAIIGHWEFDFRPPRSWSRQVDEPGHKIIFTSPSTRSAVTVLFTANSPGALPDTDVLRAQALQENPGASFVQTAICPTSYKPARFFDLVRVPAPGVVQRIRHVFVTEPDGEVEFILAASDDEFGPNKPRLMEMVATFRVTAVTPKTP